MCASADRYHHRQCYSQNGFSLLELLAVITLLAILATVAIVSYDNVDKHALDVKTEFQLAELRKALLQFRRDTSAFPCGVYHESFRPYELDLAKMKYTDMPAPTATNPEKKAWCEQNGLRMLVDYPFVVEDEYHPLWNPDTRRGWNGPYISAEGLTDAWGNAYLLIDPELDYQYPPTFCRELGATSNRYYECRAINSEHYDDSVHTIDGATARIASAWSDGTYSKDANGLHNAVGVANPDGSLPDECVSPEQANGSLADNVLCLLR